LDERPSHSAGKAWLVFVNALARLKTLLLVSGGAGGLLCLLFGLFTQMASTGPIDVGLVDEDASALSDDFRAYATTHLNLRFVEDDLAALTSELVEKRISAIIEIPAGFEDAVVAGTAGAFQVTFMGDYANRMFIQGYLEEYTTAVSMVAAGAGGDAAVFTQMLAEARAQAGTVVTVPLDVTQAQREADRAAFITIMGFFMMLGSLVALGLATAVHDDRTRGTYDRVRASDVPPAAYVTGFSAAGLVAVVTMVVVFFVYLLATGVGHHVALAPAALLSLLFGLFVVGFALAAGMYFRTKQGIVWAVIAGSTILNLLGGAYFPLEFTPTLIQQIAHASPMFWLSDGLRQAQDGNTPGWLLCAAVLTAVAALCFMVAGRRFAARQATRA
jgi:ABC-2 type transport system permease protein